MQHTQESRSTVADETAGGTSKSGFQLPCDVRESGTEYAVFLDIPGVDEDDLNVTWDADELVISGHREFDHDLEDAEEFIRLERPYGAFQYRTTFAKPVVASAITAKYRRGVLKIRVPKSAACPAHPVA